MAEWAGGDGMNEQWGASGNENLDGPFLDPYGEGADAFPPPDFIPPQPGEIEGSDTSDNGGTIPMYEAQDWQVRATDTKQGRDDLFVHTDDPFPAETPSHNVGHTGHFGKHRQGNVGPSESRTGDATPSHRDAPFYDTTGQGRFPRDLGELEAVRRQPTRENKAVYLPEGTEITPDSGDLTPAYEDFRNMAAEVLAGLDHDPADPVYEIMLTTIADTLQNEYRLRTGSAEQPLESAEPGAPIETPVPPIAVGRATPTTKIAPPPDEETEGAEHQRYFLADPLDTSHPLPQHIPEVLPQRAPGVPTAPRPIEPARPDEPSQPVPYLDLEIIPFPAPAEETPPSPTEPTDAHGNLLDTGYRALIGQYKSELDQAIAEGADAATIDYLRQRLETNQSELDRGDTSDEGRLRYDQATDTEATDALERIIRGLHNL